MNMKLSAEFFLSNFLTNLILSILILTTTAQFNLIQKSFGTN